MGSDSLRVQSHSHSNEHPDALEGASPGHLEPLELHGAYFEVDDQLKIVRWPEETAQRTRIAKAEALGRHCWEIVHPGRATPPLVCERFCLAKKDQAQHGQDPGRASVQYCPVAALPTPERGALIWMPSQNKQMSNRENVTESLLVRGCLSAKLGDLGGTLDFVRRYCAADDCELFLLDAFKEEVFYSGCEGFDRMAFSEMTRIPLGAGYPGGVTARQKPMYTNDFQNDRVFLRDSVRRCGIRSFLGFPLSEKGRPLGYIGLGWRNPSIPISSLIPRLEGLLPLVHFSISMSRYEPSRSLNVGRSLSIRCFGGFDVHHGGESIPLSAFKRRKAIQLLKMLLLRAPQPVHRDYLIDQLWPEVDPLTGGNRLHGVVHALRSALETGRTDTQAFYVRHEQDYYYFDTSSDHFVDLFHFRRMLDCARDARRRNLSPEQIIDPLESAVTLYRGDLFADDLYEEWQEGPRTQLRHQYLDAVRELVKQYAKVNRFEEIVTLLRMALDLDPCSEDLHQSLIQTLVLLGRQTEAVEQFKFCVQTIRKNLNIEPREEILALATLLRI